MAISGGVDSTALLHYMKSREKECGYTLCAVHCEHGIRGEESLQDQAFVEAFCGQLNVPLFTFACDCVKKAKEEKLSLETAARAFRLQCFSEIIQSGRADVIATAHHVSDLAETVLFRLARGTALHGVGGMKERQGMFIRPFLSWTKEEIYAYAKEHGLAYRTDATNAQTDATRNKLRLQVFPALKEAVEGAEKNLVRFANRAAEDDALLYQLSQELIASKNGQPFVKASVYKPLFTRACLTVLRELGVTHDYTSVHLDALFSLLELEKGACVHLPRRVVARKEKDGIVLFYAVEKQTPIKACAPFTENGFDGGRYAVSVQKTPVDALETVGKILCLDSRKLPKDAVFRFRRAGDWMRTAGGKKTLKKFFNEREIPTEERAFLPLIAQENGAEVYAVCGVEAAVAVKAENGEGVYVYLQKRPQGTDVI